MALRKWINRNKTGYIFIFPPLLLYAIFFLYPFTRTIYLSLVEWKGLGPKVFVGFDNYIRAIKDSMIWYSLSHNLIWVVISTILPISIGLLLAVLLWTKKTKGLLFFRTIYFMPVILSAVIVSLIWRWIYNPTFGMLNQILKTIGLDFLIRGWLSDPHIALYSVLAAAIWAHFGFCLVIFLAGLQNVDLELINAAELDGANFWQKFIHIIIPQISNVFTMVVSISIIGGFGVFDLVFVMTKTGPGQSTETIGTYIYKQSFVLERVGYGAALCVMLTLIILLVTVIFLKIRERTEV